MIAPAKAGTPYNCRGPATRSAGARFVVTATDIFINGIIGVFTGITVLYLLMRILAAAVGRPARESAPADRASE